VKFFSFVVVIFKFCFKLIFSQARGKLILKVVFSMDKLIPFAVRSIELSFSDHAVKNSIEDLQKVVSSFKRLRILAIQK